MRGMPTLTALFSVCLMICCSGLARAEQIPWQTDIEAALREASQSGQPVLMQFTASWCSYCKRMEKGTWTDPALAERVSSSFVTVLVDADEHKDLLNDLEIRGLPTVLVVSPKLEVIHRISGFQTAEAMMTHLDRAERQNASRTPQSRASRPSSAAAGTRTPPAAANAGRTPAANSRTPSAAAKRSSPELTGGTRTPPAKAPAAKAPVARTPTPSTATRDSRLPVKSISRSGNGSSDEELPEFPVEPEEYVNARERQSGESPGSRSPEIVEPEEFRQPAKAVRKATVGRGQTDAATYPDDWSDAEEPAVVHRSAPVNSGIVGAKPARAATGPSGAGRTGGPVAAGPLQPAFDGNSLVSARDARAVVAGSSRHQLKWKGQLLYFATAEELEMFSSNPQRYWPMLDGDCALTLLQANRRVQGDLEHAALFRGRIWVFSSAEEMREFVGAPANVADEVQALLEQ